MTDIEYKEKIIELLKEIEKVSNEYCEKENTYICMFIDDEGYSVNNNYWTDGIKGINIHEWRENEKWLKM